MNGFVRARTLGPLALAAAYALWTFWPDRAAMPGWGGDAYFNLWTFELLWRRMDALGAHHLFSRSFWSAPIFGGDPLGLAYSENQLYAALFLLPLWRVLHDSVLVLSWGAILLTLAAFGCAYGWLRALGIRELAGAGALLFACCGFVQSQYAHYQNLCLFVLPLALWSWASLERKPGPWRAVLCAAAFGWIAGWNLYYQLFADLLLIVLVSLPRAVPPIWRAVALLGAAAVQAPIAWKYVELERTIGSLGVSVTYGALPQSFLGTALRPTLLQRFLPGYPHVEVPIEAAGFLGFAWAALLLLALANRRARGWALASAIAFWAALGLGHGLFDVLHLLPGFSGMRAAGRFQALSTLFAVPAVLFILEARRGPARWAPLLLVALELVPAGPSLRLPVAADLGNKSTAFDDAVRGAGPLLVVPRLDPRLQLYLLPGGATLLQGMSGRAPANVELVDSFFERPPWTADSLSQVLELTRAPLVVAADPEWDRELSRSSRLRRVGCFPHYDLQLCLFRSSPSQPAGTLRLDRDAKWEYGIGAEGWPRARLVARSSGLLDYDLLGRCTLRETTRFPVLPGFARELHFPGAQLEGGRVESGQVVLVRESRQWIFHLPEWARPTRTFKVRCPP
jgi:hypothetical protein